MVVLLKHVIPVHLLITSVVLAELYKPNTRIACSKESHCPPDWPCCSPYGDCGSGPVCLGGCNPKLSFEDTACAPLPILYSPATELRYDRSIPPSSSKDEFFQQMINEHYPQEAPSNFEKEILQNNKLHLNSRGIIHFTDYLMTDSVDKAKDMLSKYQFLYSGPINIDPQTNDIQLNMPKQSSGSLITSAKYFLYGKLHVRLRAARSIGVVTGLVLISQVGDEIDFEFLGAELNFVQTNYYSQGELIHTNMQKYHIPTNIWATYHTYSIDWNPDRILWMVEGQIIRTLFKRDTWDPVSKRFKYPETPMRLEIAIWPGGAATNPPGTISWAGGLINWDTAPDILEKGQFSVYVQHANIVPYINPKITEKQRDVGTHQGCLKMFTFAYDSKKNPLYNEDSLKWHCCIIPKMANWRSSGKNI